MIEIPADYRQRVVQFVGEPAAEWLAALPDVVADLKPALAAHAGRSFPAQHARPRRAGAG